MNFKVNHRVVPGEQIIFKLKQNTREQHDQIERLLARFDLHSFEQYRPEQGYYVLITREHLEDGEDDVDDILDLLRRHQAVEYAKPDMVLRC